jgi:hypothetical protein
MAPHLGQVFLARTLHLREVVEPWTSMPTHRVSRCVSFALGLALGTGEAALVSLLRPWFAP